MKKYNIIGDTHGRTHWERLIREDCANIFVGDYFDPYEDIPFEKLRANFEKILWFARTHTDTILLLGNHDLHYLHHERGGSRKDIQHEKEIEKLFLDNMYLFEGMAFAISKDILVSHAGVTAEWLKKTEYAGTPGNAYEIAAHINSIFWDGYTERSNGTSDWGEHPWETGLGKFQFGYGATSWGDVYGTSPEQSPAWIRPTTLVKPRHNGLPDGKQIVGHTQAKTIIPDAHPHVIIVDTLGQGFLASLIVEHEDDNDVFKVNQIQ